jgi:hypothetical protein
MSSEISDLKVSIEIFNEFTRNEFPINFTVFSIGCENIYLNNCLNLY